MKCEDCYALQGDAACDHKCRTKARKLCDERGYLTINPANGAAENQIKLPTTGPI
jgi:hypothetical protein